VSTESGEPQADGITDKVGHGLFKSNVAIDRRGEPDFDHQKRDGNGQHGIAEKQQAFEAQRSAWSAAVCHLLAKALQPPDLLAGAPLIIGRRQQTRCDRP
jgi:hypothetical protein